MRSFPAGESTLATCFLKNKQVSYSMAYLAPKVKWRKPKTYRNDVIATANATGCVLQYWNSLLVGDELTIISIVDDEEYVYLLDAIFDTSNIEEWKNFRFNYRGLSRISCAMIFFKIKLAFLKHHGLTWSVDIQRNHTTRNTLKCCVVICID